MTKHKRDLMSQFAESILKSSDYAEKLSLFYEDAYREGQGVLVAEMKAVRNKCPICGSHNGINAQTFYVIKRDEEPRYWNTGFGWQEKPMLTTSAGEHNRWRRDLDLKALLPTNPTMEPPAEWSPEGKRILKW